MNPTSVSAKCVTIVKQYEGFEPWPYFCPAKVRTVGYGHVIIPGDAITYPLPETEACELLMSDINKFIPQVLPLLKVKLTQNQFDAVLSFVFNVGAGAFGKSTMLKYINQGKFQLAEAEFSKWIMGGGKILNGLVKRRKTEAHLFSTGQVQFY